MVAVPLLIMPLTLLSLQVVSDDDAPSAAILFNVARNLGGAVGVAGLVTFVEHYKTVFYQQSLLQFSPTSLTPQQSADSSQQLIQQLSQHSSIWAFNGAFAALSVSLLLMALLFLALYLAERYSATTRHTAVPANTRIGNG